jgi:hypothetical protein
MFTFLNSTWEEKHSQLNSSKHFHTSDLHFQPYTLTYILPGDITITIYPSWAGYNSGMWGMMVMMMMLLLSHMVEFKGWQN